VNARRKMLAPFAGVRLGLLGSPRFGLRSRSPYRSARGGSSGQ